MTSAGRGRPLGGWLRRRALGEHEDPVWGGTEAGLEVAHRTLLPLLVR